MMQQETLSTGAAGPTHAPVLLVEDDEYPAEALVAVLETNGYAVTHCSNGRAALEYLRSGAATPEVILLDLVMPEMNGWQFRVEQRRDPLLSSIPVIAMSADGSAQAEAIDAQAYLTKPLVESQLLRTLDFLLLQAREHPGAPQHGFERPSLERVVSAIRHEINNPLVAVLGNLELARRHARQFVPELAGAQKARAVAIGNLIDGADRGAQRVAQVVEALSPRPPDARTTLGTVCCESDACAGSRHTAHSRKPRVLAIDDDDMMCDLLDNVLSDRFQARVERKAVRALEDLLAGASYDLIVCDLMMPELNGIELHKKLASARPDMAQRMLFMTGGTFTDAAQSFVARLERGSYLAKPFRTVELMEAMDRWLQRHGLREDHELSA